MSVDSFLAQNNDIKEANWSAHSRALTIGAPFVTSGFEITDGGSLNATVGDGVALVNGMRVKNDSNTTQALTDDDTNYVWLEPDATVTDELAGTDPGNALLLGSVLTAGGTISSIAHSRNIGLDPDGTRQTNRLNVFIKKLADESVTSSTTLQNDDELLFTVLNGEVWDVTCYLDVEQGSGVPGFKCAFAGGDGSRYQVGADGIDGAVHGKFEAFATTGLTTDQASLSAGNPVFLRSTIHATSNTTLILKWAQGTSNGSATILKAGSVMIARRLTG